MDHPLTTDGRIFHLPDYIGGRRHYTQRVWEQIAMLGYSYGDAGGPLLAAATDRVAMIDAAIPRAGGRRTRRQSFALERVLRLAGAQAVQNTLLYQVAAPTGRTRSAVRYAIARYWVPALAIWDTVIAAITDPAIYADPQAAMDRLADIPEAREILRDILQEDHGVRFWLLPGFTTAALATDRSAASWIQRIEDHDRQETARIDAYLARRAAAVDTAVRALIEHHHRAGSLHPRVILPVLARMGVTTRRGSAWEGPHRITLQLPERSGAVYGPTYEAAILTLIREHPDHGGHPAGVSLADALMPCARDLVA